ncbi:MAG: hypothetical protein ABL926_00450 [Novosphingobium sp.]|uniref:hypothetical protein n=1 Tax=Novosphingobium sp. TaxID=1874826 RepID=UPI0032B7D9C4
MAIPPAPELLVMLEQLTALPTADRDLVLARFDSAERHRILGYLQGMRCVEISSGLRQVAEGGDGNEVVAAITPVAAAALLRAVRLQEKAEPKLQAQAAAPMRETLLRKIQRFVGVGR